MPKQMTKAFAQEIAVEALTAIVGNEDQLHRFLNVTGADPGTIRQAAEDEAFLRGVMEYVLQDDDLVISTATAVGIKPEEVMQAAHALGAVWESDTP